MDMWLLKSNDKYEWVGGIKMKSRKIKIREAYKSSNNFYDDALTAKGLLFKVYNKIIWGMKDEDYVEKLLSHISDDFKGKLLDIPVGTAIFTYKKYQKMKEATLVTADYSMDMLTQAKKKFADAGIHNIKCLHGDVVQLPFESETFDIVLSMNGFHAFPDKERALEEMLRVLKKGGVFCGCFYIYGQRKLTDFFVKHILVSGGWFTPPFYSISEWNAKLEGQCTDIQINHIKSMMYFICVKS